MREANWKAITTAVYLIICIFDFLGMPMILFSLRGAAMETVLALQAANVDPNIVSELSKIGHAQEWVPFTLRGGGLFHLSFGAIITGSVIKGKKDGD